MFYRLLYMASNVLLAKLIKVPSKLLRKVFVINYGDELNNIVRYFQKAYRMFMKDTTSKTIMLPISCNYHTIKNYFNDYILLPGGALLLLRRPTLTDPLDFASFIKDSKIWLQRFNLVSKKDLDLIFVYDPMSMPHVSAKYIPTIIINKSDVNKHAHICFSQLAHHEGIISIDGMNILLGIWSRKEIIENTLRYIRNYEVISTYNPFLCSDPFSEFNSNCRISIDYDRRFKFISIGDNCNSNVLIIEFLSSYVTVLEQYLNCFYYLWIPLPSTQFLPYLYNGSRDIIKVKKLLIISPINNFSEKGSISNDRLWINLIKRIAIFDKISLVIDNS
ncbi:MAG: hypothetical protein QW101_01625 [Ignisphaera sp.]|uniref:Uncharacterized protein n=1 Tax=Ignisphaera aggregans TaxID=334771 RepID=A0A7J3MZC8_9CREN